MYSVCILYRQQYRTCAVYVYYIGNSIVHITNTLFTGRWHFSYNNTAAITANILTSS